MAQIFYTTLSGLENCGQQIQDDSTAQTNVTFYKFEEAHHSSIIVDEGDVFQCGKCKEKFSFSDFVLHKKNACLAPRNDLIISSIQESYQIQNLDELNSDGNQQIVFSESYSIDSSPLPPALDEPDRTFPTDSNADPAVGLKNCVLIENDSHLVNSLLEDNLMLVEGQKHFLPSFNEGISALPLIDLKDESFLINDKTSNEPVQFVDPPIYESSTQNEDVECKKSQRKEVAAAPTQLKCSVCEKHFRKTFDLKQHIRSHTGERPFLCVVCGRAFAQKSNAIKHMSSHKVWPKKLTTIPENPFVPVAVSNEDSNKNLISVDVNSFKCQYCSEVMSTYLAWRSHMKIHRDEKVFQCVQNSCRLTFRDIDAFLTHIRAQHSEKAQYSCHLCTETFSSLNKIGLHQCSVNSESISPNKKIICHKCGLKYSLGSDHICNAFPCPRCGRTFSSERFLRRHFTVHSSLMLHLCTECNKAFKSAKSLNLHRVVHSQLRPFVCQTCFAGFSRRDKLARHNLIHAGVKKFKCPYLKSMGCTKEFSRQDKLKNHLAVHKKKQNQSPDSATGSNNIQTVK